MTWRPLLAARPSIYPLTQPPPRLSLQAQLERDALEKEAAEARELRGRLEAAEQARCAAEERLKTVSGQQKVVERENGRYEELLRENRKLEAMLAEAQDMCRQSQVRAEQVDKLEARIEVLNQEKQRLQAEADYAAHVRKLFANVTSKTNEVQQVSSRGGATSPG